MSDANPSTPTQAIAAGGANPATDAKPATVTKAHDRVPAGFLHHFRIWFVRFLWLALGISAGLLLVVKNPGRASRLGFKNSGSFSIVSHPAHGGEDIAIGAIADQITKAQAEVAILGGRLSSRKILDALIAKGRNGVSVDVVIPKGPSQRDIASYLARGGLQGVYLSSQDFDEQLLIIDGRVLICTVPLSAKSSREMIGSILVSNDSATVKSVRSYLQERMLESSKPK